MASNRIAELVNAEDGRAVVLQGNIAFAVGCARGGIHAADGYPGTPSTEVIHKGLSQVQDHLRVGWSVNEANAVALAFGATMAGDDAVVTMKIPGLFQAGDVVATAAGFTAKRAGLVLYIASDFTPSSTQYVTDPRYFLKTCFIPVLEPRTHQEVLEIGPLAARMARTCSTPVAVLTSGMLCHSEGLVRLNPRREVPRYGDGLDLKRFMNLPRIARQNYVTMVTKRLPALRRFASTNGLYRVEMNDPSHGVIVHGVTELILREIWDDLPVKPSVLSLCMTNPVPRGAIARFLGDIDGETVVLGDGLRFVQDEIRGLGHTVSGKADDDIDTEWTPEALLERLGGSSHTCVSVPAKAPAPVPRPPNICAGCPYRAFGLVVQKMKKQGKIVGSFGDIGCNTLLFFLDAIDSCTCMGASDAERQGAVLADPSLAGKVISVLGDSTECHSGLDATRNAVFRNVPGVKVVLDNTTAAMTGGQPAPSSPHNLAGEETKFDLVAALEGEGATVRLVDAFDMKAVKRELRAALKAAGQGEFTVLVIRGACMHDLPAGDLHPRYEIAEEECEQCDRCFICPGLEKDEKGFPRFTNLCSGCGGNQAVCVQTCARKAIIPFETAMEENAPPPLPALPEEPAADESEPLPTSLRLAVRGVGGQGNLFLGKVLAEVALRAGFGNVVKGETHGMAQLGGPVISTFACGDVHSPVPAPGRADALVALERSEALRPGFLALLRPGGTVLLNRLAIVPAGLDEAKYPSEDAIREVLKDFEVLEFDALGTAASIGDKLGRTSNVVALGALSTIGPFSRIPLSIWRDALLAVSPAEMMKRGNVAAFLAGREAVG